MERRGDRVSRGERDEPAEVREVPHPARGSATRAVRQGCRCGALGGTSATASRRFRVRLGIGFCGETHIGLGLRSEARARDDNEAGTYPERANQVHSGRGLCREARELGDHVAWVKIPKENHAVFYARLPKDPRIQTLQMFGAAAAKVNGHLFGGLFARSFMVKLGDADHADALALDGAEKFDPMGNGRVMSNSVLMPESLMDEPEEITAWLQKALDYAATLPPKDAKASKTKRPANAATASASKAKNRASTPTPKGSKATAKGSHATTRAASKTKKTKGSKATTRRTATPKTASTSKSKATTTTAKGSKATTRAASKAKGSKRPR
jgi:TfoX/Sxy family transcriptional regulator of competence genes